VGRCGPVNPAPRILFFQRSVPPDHSAAGSLLFDLAQDLTRCGWEVWIAGTRTSPDVPAEESCEGIHFCRGLVPPVDKSSLRSRFLALPGTWLAMFWAVRRCPRPEILITLTDPPLSACAGTVLARLLRCRHVHWCQDLYPQVAAAAGVIQEDGIVFRLLSRLMRAALRDCSRVVAVGRCMQEHLGNIPTTLIPNWARVAPVSAPAPETGFRILYSGNLGRAHDFEGLNSAAKMTSDPKGACPGPGDASAKVAKAGSALRKFVWSSAFRRCFFGCLPPRQPPEGGTPNPDALCLTGVQLSEMRPKPGDEAASELDSDALSDPSLVWTVCGDGPQASAISLAVERIPPVAWDDYPKLLASAHAHLITLRKEFCGLVVPSKLYDCAASARPILFAGPADSECARAILENHMGLVVPDRDGPALAEAARSLAQNPELCRQMSAAASQFSQVHRLQHSGDRFDALLRSLLR